MIKHMGVGNTQTDMWLLRYPWKEGAQSLLFPSSMLLSGKNMCRTPNSGGTALLARLWENGPRVIDQF